MKKILLLVLSVITFQSQAQTYMYGTTFEGGDNSLGTIYRVDENGQNFQKVFDFSTSTGGNPRAGLTLAPNGKMYGFTTAEGQAVNPGGTPSGSFYEFDPVTNNLQVITYFNTEEPLGFEFNDAPLLASNGNLYAASTYLGSNIENANVFISYEISTGSLSILDTLDYAAFGYLDSKLMQASDNNIYFTTVRPLPNHAAIIKYDLTVNTFTLIHNSLGAVVLPPNSVLSEYDVPVNNPLFEASNGMLYGASRGGGNYDEGNVFKINKDGSGYQTLHIFTDGLAVEGFIPAGGFVEHNGKLYSATQQQGALNQNSGAFYTINLSTDAVEHPHILDLEGIDPLGTFVLSPNGRLYITCSGRSTNNGSLVEWSLTNNTLTQRHAFNGTGGAKPYRNGLCIVDFSSLSVDESNLADLNISIFPNPVSDYLSIKSSGKNTIEKIDLYNTNGQLVYSSYSQEPINISRFESGVYFIQLKINGSKIITKKIIKE